MTKVRKHQQRSGSRHHRTNPYILGSFRSKILKDSHHKKQKNALEKKEYQDAKCSVCIEYPHNAVLLLCSSHHKGCRPYMCATSHRYSNCLDQYKKAYSKSTPSENARERTGSVDDPVFSLGSDELLCPLCRGQVKGWTVVKRARKFLNSKKRSCMQDNCPFVGSYKNLRKHVRESHPLARPREVDPSLAEKWKKLENDLELNDVMSTINSTMPGSVIMGDYVVERNFRGYSRDREMDLDTLFGVGSLNDTGDGFSIYDDDDDEYELDVIEGRIRNYVPHIARRHGRYFRRRYG
ncbi:uncharacterized protein [Rutidosis leptorrhynchoides]|uniref:uncharacterized protein n=1 Tax=Rutidosis leptorrhynchoides TaxID=125765 RepID=UPI003A99DE4F